MVPGVEMRQARAREPATRVDSIERQAVTTGAKRLEVSCLDLCDHGPNMVVEPSGMVYGHLNVKTARAVYDAETGDGPPRPDLELEI